MLGVKILFGNILKIGDFIRWYGKKIFYIMGLENYTTQELRAEIARRSSINYIYITGVVDKICNKDFAFLNWRWKVNISSDSRQKYGLPNSYIFKLANGVFNKSNHPEVGDTVKIRYRVTKARTDIRLDYAQICEII